ncbi:MAG: hypothetical protein H7834_15840 [Magnetococcus sp. YQC-9]
MTLARFSQEAFFAKNAPRAAFVSVVSVFWKRRSHLARSLAKNYASRDGCGLKSKAKPWERNLPDLLFFFTNEVVAKPIKKFLMRVIFI